MSSAPTHGHDLGGQRSDAETLAHETNMPVEKVEAIYAAEVAELERTARIKTYIGVIATSRTRLILKGLPGADS